MRRSGLLFRIMATGILLSAACQRHTEAPANTPPAAAAEKTPLPVTALPASAFKLEWTTPTIPSPVPAAKEFPVQITVMNTGDKVWPNSGPSDPTGGVGAVRLSYRWWPAGRESMMNLYNGFDARIELPHPVAPGETITVPVAVKAPSQPGDYKLQFDLVQELVAWFAGQGAPKLILPVTVQ
jgi:hypothetical protein